MSRYFPDVRWHIVFKLLVILTQNQNPHPYILTMQYSFRIMCYITSMLLVMWLIIVVITTPQYQHKKAATCV